jgi:outer membrane protein assembly factor BamB
MARMDRRDFLQTIGFTGGGAALLSGGSKEVSASTHEVWPQFGYDNAKTGHAPNNTGPIDKIQEQWVFNAGDSPLKPVVGDDTIYVGTSGNGLHALSTTDGSRQWDFQATTESNVTSSPTVADNTAYIGYDATVQAIDARTGVQKWQFDTEQTLAGTPAVAEGSVYVTSADPFESDPAAVYSLNQQDGSAQWSVDISGSGALHSPAVVEGMLFFGNWSGSETGLYALDADSGTVQWEFDNSGGVSGSPAVSNGTVYVGSRDNSIYSIDANSGKELWRFETGNNVDSSPSVANSTVYVGSQDGAVYALDASDGTEKWRFETGGKVNHAVAVVGNIVYAGSTDNHAYALNAEDGTEIWRFDTGGGIVSPPAVANGNVYIGNDNNQIYALTGQSPTATPAQVNTPISNTQTSTSEQASNPESNAPDTTPASAQTGATEITQAKDPDSGTQTTFDGFLNRFIVGLLSTEAIVMLGTALVVVIIVLTWENNSR